MRSYLNLEQLDVRDVPAVFYVAPTGLDTAAGGSSTPWKTLQRAANGVHAGDQVIVRAGTYVGFNLTADGTPSARITFSAQPGVVVNAPNPWNLRDGINLEGADYATIDGFKVINQPRTGIRSAINHGAIIQNNITDNNSKWGIFTGFSEDVVIQNNVASNSHTQHGIYVSNSADNPIVRGNTVFGNYGSGIQLNADASMTYTGFKSDGIITNALIERNRVYNNGAGGGAALNLDGVQSSRIQNNLLYNNSATGIALFKGNGATGSSNNVVANNTIVNGATSRWAILVMGGSTGNTVFNNIILNNNAARGALNVFADSRAGLHSDYNMVVDRFTTDDGATRKTLAQWQTATGQDAHSRVATASTLFVNAAVNNYRLSATSPARNAGVASLFGMSAPPSDMTGYAHSIDGRWDIGAFEYQASGSVPPPPIGN